MPCASQYFLIDELGGIWQLNVTSNGILNISATVNPTFPPVNSLSLTDIVTGEVFLLSVLSRGNIVLTGKPSFPSSDNYLIIPSPSPNSKTFKLQVANGLLQTVGVPQIKVQIPIVGTIYNPDLTYLPPFTQPGGPFTPTFPQQDPGQMIGLFVAGCGHWFNNWDVISATVECDQVAVMRCPLCGYVQRILDPFEVIYEFQNEILLA